jgi:hypothetical protein
MTAGELARHLSFREFQLLCTFFDLKYQEKHTRPEPRAMRYRHGTGTDEQLILGSWKDVRFSILDIQRLPERVTAICRNEEGETVSVYWPGRVIPFVPKTPAPRATHCSLAMGQLIPFRRKA